MKTKPSKPNKPGKVVFCSLNEFEIAYFPVSYKARIEAERAKIPGSFGSKLAAQFLENISRRISK